MILAQAVYHFDCDTHIYMYDVSIGNVVVVVCGFNKRIKCSIRQAKRESATAHTTYNKYFTKHI